jgi:L-threonylcarbamoyladenylate synthase
MGQAAELIRKGGLVVFPTGSLYGLGADAFDVRAVDRVFQVKTRDRDRPLLILIACLPDLVPLVRAVPATAAKLIEAFWPGSITLVFEAADCLPSILTGRTGKIGIRLVNHPVASSLIKAAGRPITGTSANLSGEGGCTDVAQLAPALAGAVDMILDAGPLQGGASSVVDVTVNPPRIIRQGVVPAEKITAALSLQPYR